jgi:hypothetical protein
LRRRNAEEGMQKKECRIKTKEEIQQDLSEFVDEMKRKISFTR